MTADVDRGVESEDSRPNNKLDPASSTCRLFPCAKCHEPVASSAWSGRVVLRCGYCSYEDERELVLETKPAPDAPYRDRGREKERSKALTLDLNGALQGHVITQLDMGKLRASIVRTPLSPEDLPDVEWERVWIGVWLARMLAMRGDRLRARIALETSLEATRTPAYRALLLANLAHHAASIGATALAKKWLAACPDAAVVEVDSEIRAARARIAFAKGRFEDVCRMTGDNIAGAGFSGGGLYLAIGVNLVAHERLGLRKHAKAIIHDLARKNLLGAVVIPMSAHRLGSEEVVRYFRSLRINDARTIAIGTLMFVAALDAFTAAGTVAHDVATILGAGLACAAVAATVAWISYPLRERLAPRTLLQRVAAALVILTVAGGGLAWLRTQPPGIARGQQPAPTSLVPAPAESGLTIAVTQDNGLIAIEPLARVVDEEVLESEMHRSHALDMDERAAQIAKRCLDVNPRNAPCASFLVESEMREARALGMKERAQQAAKRCLEVDPKNAACLGFLNGKGD